MSEQTKIQWCDSTANPVIGCEQISPGCADCYAKRSTPARQLRARGIETWGPQGVRHETKGFEKAMLAFNARPWVCDDCGSAPGSDGDCECGQIGAARRVHRRRVFVNSLSDWLDPRWPVETLARTLDVWRRCPDIEIICCTKRPELWPDRIESVVKWLEAADCKWPQNGWSSLPLRNWLADWFVLHKPPSQVTILATVENQEQADKRIPHLLRIPAARRGLSLEPLLGPVDLTVDRLHDCLRRVYKRQPGIDWLIIGGESGAKARPCHVEWIRSLVQQGKAADVPVFVKQLGSNSVHALPPNAAGWTNFRTRLKHPKGADPAEWPEDLRVRERLIVFLNSFTKVPVRPNTRSQLAAASRSGKAAQHE